MNRAKSHLLVDIWRHGESLLIIRLNWQWTGRSLDPRNKDDTHT